MMKYATLFLCVLSASLVLAFQDFGPLKEAMLKHSTYFEIGSVHTGVVNNVEGIIFSGESERLFDKNIEHESELYYEAEMNAKASLYRAIAGTNHIHLAISQCETLYRFCIENKYVVLLFTPLNSICINHKPALQTSVSEKCIPDFYKPQLHTEMLEIATNTPVALSPISTATPLKQLSPLPFATPINELSPLNITNSFPIKQQ